MRTTRIAIVGLLLLSLMTAGCGSDTNDEETGLANPASVFCEEQGGTVDIRSDAGGNQYGFCVFEDGSECDEWAFFRGECAPGA
jgi:putative hemolysin